MPRPEDLPPHVQHALGTIAKSCDRAERNIETSRNQEMNNRMGGRNVENAIGKAYDELAYDPRGQSTLDSIISPARPGGLPAVCDAVRRSFSR